MSRIGIDGGGVWGGLTPALPVFDLTLPHSRFAPVPLLRFLALPA